MERPGADEFKKLLDRSGIAPEDIEKVNRMNVWQSAKRGENDEWDVQDLYAMQVTPKPDPSAFEGFHATPARITPSRKKAVKRDHNVIVAMGDTQVGYRRVLDYETNEEELVPTHDERAMRVARYLCRDLRPDTIVNLGDNIDLAELSKYPKDSDHYYRTLTPALQRVHDYYAELRADNPDARMLEVASNHNERFNKYVMGNAEPFYGMQRAASDSKYPVLTYPYLANLEHVDVEWIGGYPAGEFVYGEEYDAPPIVFRHGTENSSNGTTAAKIMKNNPETHNVQGHDHIDSEAWHVTRAGRQLGSFVVGALCSSKGAVPGFHNAVNEEGHSVHHQENWSSSVLVVNDYKNGDYEFNRIMIRDGSAYYNGKRYEA